MLNNIKLGQLSPAALGGLIVGGSDLTQWGPSSTGQDMHPDDGENLEWKMTTHIIIYCDFTCFYVVR